MNEGSKAIVADYLARCDAAMQSETGDTTS